MLVLDVFGERSQLLNFSTIQGPEPLTLLLGWGRAGCKSRQRRRRWVHQNKSCFHLLALDHADLGPADEGTFRAPSICPKGQRQRHCLWRHSSRLVIEMVVLLVERNNPWDSLLYRENQVTGMIKSRICSKMSTYFHNHYWKYKFRREGQRERKNHWKS